MKNGNSGKRLNAVWKELNVGMQTLVDTLSKKGHKVEAKPTTKLTEEQYKILLLEFQDPKKILRSILNNCRYHRSEFIDLSDLKLSLIPKEIEGFLWLKEINLSNNQLREIALLGSLNGLRQINLSNNSITNLNGLEKLQNLETLVINNNPIVEYYNLVLNDDENHWGIIKNIIDRQQEDGGKINIELPVKIILLGNHGVGKSSLLHYLQTKNLSYSGNSTHILKIENYPKDNNMPKAIFYDFGGQDYYHGLYSAFISSGSAYLLLWCIGRNNYDTIEDTNKQNTQNYKVEYWLSLKNYIETNTFNGKLDPLLLVQSHAYDNETAIFYTYDDIFSIQNRFYVSLNRKFDSKKNTAALNYLNEEIDAIIEKKKINRIESRWYLDFYRYIINQKTVDAIKLETILQFYKPTNKNSSNEIKRSLIEELKQFHNQGLVLYYPSIDENEVWLNPEGLVEQIHSELLSLNILKEQGGIIKKSDLEKHNQKIIELLKKQKVLFEHEYGENGVEYIIPNFLPLVNKNDPEYSLYTFGLNTPLFILKFINFIPIGLINQLICHYGAQPDKKRFWRNQLLFTFEKSKILIQLNFEKLEIKVFAVFTKQNIKEQNAISKYLFYTIISFYWDKEPLLLKDIILMDSYKHRNNSSLKRTDNSYTYSYFDENQKEIMELEISQEKMSVYNSVYSELNQSNKYYPSDLFISVDDKYFVKYNDIINHNRIDTRIMGFKIENDRTIGTKSKEIPVKQFEIFSNKEFSSIKKVFISYSKDDLKMVHRFRDALIPLTDDGIIENPWYCTFLEAGSSWDEEIQHKLAESDLIFFMCSISFLKTKYIREHEIKVALASKKTIIPIILNFCEWESCLGKYTALPYTGKPIADFKNQDLAWLIITKGVRWAIEIDESKKQELDKQIKNLYERLVLGNLNND